MSWQATARPDTLPAPAYPPSGRVRSRPFPCADTVGGRSPTSGPQGRSGRRSGWYRVRGRRLDTNRRSRNRCRAIPAPARSAPNLQMERDGRPERARGLILGYLKMAQSLGVFRQAAVQRLGQLLPEIGLVEQRFLARIAEEP